MGELQQPEIAGSGPIPEDNLPGHHPEVEQDKPTRPPKRATRPKESKTSGPRGVQRFPLRRDEPFAVVSRLFGVTGESGYVELDDEHLEIRFGPWHVTTPLSNVEGAEVTGPFHWWKVIGPPHLSFKDRGITFATSDKEAVCIKFREPVRGIDVRGWIRHPGATVTVADPHDLARAIKRAAEAA